MTTHAQTDDFDIGKAVFDLLKDLPPERQQRILRWVSEGLGVTFGTAAVQVPSSAAALVQQKQFPAAPGVSGTDIKSFVISKAPKSDNQFAAVVAYYYRFEASPSERRDTIDGTLLQEAARLAGRKRFSNPRNTLNNAKNVGYLDGTAPGIFSINSVGENLVAMTLPGGGEDSAQTQRKSRSKSSAKQKPAKANKR